MLYGMFHTEDWKQGDRAERLAILRNFMIFAPFSLFAVGFPPVAWLRTKLGIEHNESPLDSLGKTVSISFFCFLKVVEWQFCFNASVLFFHMSVPYWEALPLNYLGRHVACNACLM